MVVEVFDGELNSFGFVVNACACDEVNKAHYLGESPVQIRLPVQGTPVTIHL